MSEHAGNCGYVQNGVPCDCGLWEQSATLFKHQERIREQDARIAELESLLRDIYAAETPIDYLWCTPPWSNICDRLCELLPDVTTPKPGVEAT